MSTNNKISNFLLDKKITISPADFIYLVSNIYHEFESTSYDNRHFSITLSKKYWFKSFEAIFTVHHFDNFNILDYGCGTGFATQQFLEYCSNNLNFDNTDVSCYDLSNSMIVECQKKFQKFNFIKYYSDINGLREIFNIKLKYNIILCNAILHHMLSPEELIKQMTDSLDNNGILIIGHEPNNLFYNNKILLSISRFFRLFKKVLKKLFYNNQMYGNDITIDTFNKLSSLGIVDSNFPLEYIPKFVDIHVPSANFKNQPWGQLGFNKEYIIRASNDRLSFMNSYSYSHIKDDYAYKFYFWRKVSTLLQFLYPADGADVIFIFKKK
jgi:2-polyprenyl-3-methyl-5-hydroxy-6-metoxy-1,4-benzoquinol methylase